MSKTHRLNIDNIPVSVTRKRMKYMRITIHPPFGEIKISAPNRVSLREIQKFAKLKIDWAIDHQKSIQTKYKKSVKRYINGEKHELFGKKYRLKIIKNCDESKAILKKTLIELQVKKTQDSEEFLQEKKRLVEGLYREEMRKVIPNLIRKYQKKMDVEVKEFRIKKMKTRWGTCNIRARRIWISLELAKKPLGCLENIIVHEMTHLLERSHNRRFYKLMDQFMPKWREYESELKNSLIF